MVKVRVRKPARVFTFLARNMTLKRNDSCIVRSDRGLEYGVCVMPSETCGKDAETRYKMSVVRVATPRDERSYEQNIEDEARAKVTCKDKISDRKLAMKLIDVEYSFDRRKIVFYFTAEDRVDFRALVRDLAQDLKARIELRHIQVRDEAKMVGGIGTCGRELCCTTWMHDFMPISMKMAKRQNLSLNPSKISGQCGRLMCCLSYENDLYDKVKRTHAGAPKVVSKHLSEIRDTMEANAEGAVDVLTKTTLKDVVGAESPKAGEAPVQTARGPDPGPSQRAKTPPPSKDRADSAENPPREEARPVSTKSENGPTGKEPADPVKSTEAKAGDEAAAPKGDEAAAPKKEAGQASEPTRKRRRRRRRRGGGGRGNGAGA